MCSKECEYKDICQDYVDTSRKYMPEYSKRLKNHLLLHLIDSMINFGPTSSFSTERYNNILLAV